MEDAGQASDTVDEDVDDPVNLVLCDENSSSKIPKSFSNIVELAMDESLDNDTVLFECFTDIFAGESAGLVDFVAMLVEISKEAVGRDESCLACCMLVL